MYTYKCYFYIRIRIYIRIYYYDSLFVINNIPFIPVLSFYAN